MLEPGKILGPFRIEKELGSGAMGTVWKAVYTETNSPVAIKMIGVGLAGNETALARFEREAEILKQLRHPHIVRLFATGRYKKTPFFAMEYVEGESLDKVFERRGRLPWEEVVRLGKQLCKALKHAHEKGIIHRDLKPSNLMILKDGTLKLTDFGIAKDTDVTALTGANSTVGTAAYMSPEQCRGERNLTLKSDLYSLGVVFYELLTGEKPFQKESAVEMFLAHVNEPVERPSRKVLDIPPWLDTLVCQLMEKKPEHRPFDAAMVESALDEIDEKMAEQKSAGLDLVEARGVDRPRPGPANEGDRAAARVLRGAARKKKIRAKSTAFYEKGWFLALSLPVALAGAVALIWWLARPPSPATYYARAEAAIQAKNSERAREVLREYLATYPTLDDPNARQMRQWYEDVEVDLLARQMHNRFRAKLGKTDDYQPAVFAALSTEETGDLVEARKRWQEIAASNAAGQGEQLTYAWLAKRKIRELDQVADLDKKLQQLLDTPGNRAADEVERSTAEARRAERFEDYAKAIERYQQVKLSFIKDLDHRSYVLFACNKLHELKDRVVSGDERIREVRAELVRRRLAQAERLSKGTSIAQRDDAEKLYRDMIALYDTDTELAKQVELARKQLASISRKRN